MSSFLRLGGLLATLALGTVLLWQRDRTGDDPAETKLEKEYVNSLKMKLAVIPKGKFLMGPPKDEQGPFDFDEKGPQHEVEITKPYYVGVYPVTQGLYEQVIGNNPSYFSKQGRGKDEVEGLDTQQFPVETVSWDDAVAFCEALNKKDVKKPAGWKYELPTEAEWEYAARAGTKTAYSFGDDAKELGQYAWYEANSEGRTHAVGAKKPNPWGMYDMHGNAWQWCADWYGKYEAGSFKDPKGAPEGDFRVLRGGSWFYGPRYCRSANRGNADPESRHNQYGFRVVLRVAVKTP